MHAQETFCNSNFNQKCTYLVAMPGISTTRVCGIWWAYTTPVSGRWWCCVLAHTHRAGCTLLHTHAKGIMFKVACNRSGTRTKLCVALTGKIEVSRSFGDIHYKRLGMSAAPDIQVFNITPQDRFLLCACDGFWSCFGPQDAV